MDSHGAVASHELGQSLLDAVQADHTNAPISEGLRETLTLVKKLTLEPEAVGPADIQRVRAAGVSEEAIEDAIQVMAAFNLINRLADSLGFDLQTPEGYAKGAQMLLKRGYLL